MDDLKAKIEALKYPRKKGEYGDACIYNAAIDRVLTLLATHAAETAPVAVEPIGWLTTDTAEWLENHARLACATRTAVWNRPVKGDGGVPVYLHPPHPSAAPTGNTALVEAAQAVLDWDTRRGYPIPYAVRDPLIAALQPAAPHPTTEQEMMQMLRNALARGSVAEKEERT